MKKLVDVLELYLYKRILKISFKERIPNSEVLYRMRTQKDLLITIKIKKTALSRSHHVGERSRATGPLEGFKTPGKKIFTVGSIVHRWTFMG